MATNNNPAPEGSNLDNPLVRLSRDLKNAAKLLSDSEARYLVDSYYTLQKMRVAQGNQVAGLKELEKKEKEKGPKGKETEPYEILEWFTDNQEKLEQQMRRALDSYSDSKMEGLWAKSQYGIGPVIAAGLLAHIDMNPWQCMKHKMDKTLEACTEKKPHKRFGCERKPLLYAGQIWNYAGIGDPSVRWEKGQKRPWNASLKTLCWKIGQSFLKLSTNPDSFYGIMLRGYLEKERLKNVSGQFSEAAKEKLVRFKIGTDTEAYKWYSGQFSTVVATAFLKNGVDFYSGLVRNIPTVEEVVDPSGVEKEDFDRYVLYMQRAGLLASGDYATSDLIQALKGVSGVGGTPMLPPAHVLQRACRYTTKIFLSHFHSVAYEVRYKKKAAMPYVIDHLGHKDYIPPPNWPLEKP